MPKKNFIFKISHLNEAANARHELAQKKLPNVRIKNMVVNMTKGTENFYVYYCYFSGYNVSGIGYVSNICIDGLTFNPEGDKPVKEMALSNIKINTKQPIDCILTNVKVNQPLKRLLLRSERPSMQLKANLPLKGGRAQLRNATGITQ